MADNKGFMGRGFKFPFSIDPATDRIAMSSAEVRHFCLTELSNYRPVSRTQCCLSPV